MHLQHLRVTYCTCRPFTKCRKWIPKFTQNGNSKHLYRNENLVLLMIYSNSKDLAKSTISHKILKDKDSKKARSFNYHGYRRALISAAYKFFDKKTVLIVSVNEELAEELHKPVTEKLRRGKSMRDLGTIFGR